MVVHREPCTVRWSMIPQNQWIKIRLVNPKECIPIMIPRSGSFIAYKAYFINEYVKERKLFNMVFPFNEFNRALVGLVPMELRNNLDKQFEFEFMKSRRTILLRNWRVI